MQLLDKGRVQIKKKKVGNFPYLRDPPPPPPPSKVGNLLSSPGPSPSPSPCPKSNKSPPKKEKRRIWTKG